jgi:hypothetical protein
MKLLALASGHGRYTTTTPPDGHFSNWGMAVKHTHTQQPLFSASKARFASGACFASTVKLPPGGFRIETAT